MLSVWNTCTKLQKLIGLCSWNTSYYVTWYFNRLQIKSPPFSCHPPPDLISYLLIAYTGESKSIIFGLYPQITQASCRWVTWHKQSCVMSWIFYDLFVTMASTVFCLSWRGGRLLNRYIFDFLILPVVHIGDTVFDMFAQPNVIVYWISH